MIDISGNTTTTDADGNTTEGTIYDDAFGDDMNIGDDITIEEGSTYPKIIYDGFCEVDLFISYCIEGSPDATLLCEADDLTIFMDYS